MKNLIFYVIILAIINALTQCKKDKDEVTIHCENLINDDVTFNDTLFLLIGNAFTPNRDGLNDAFRPVTSFGHLQDYISYSFKIYDLNSNLVFQTNDIQSGWYGKEKDIGTYYYRLELETIDGLRIGRCGEVYLIIDCRPSNIHWDELIFEDQLMTAPFYNFILPPTSEAPYPICNRLWASMQE